MISNLSELRNKEKLKCNKIINEYHKINFISINEFIKQLNLLVFGDDVKDLVSKIAENPHRFVGLFRPTKPKGKLLQNLFQSHEIKFGNALEIIFEQFFRRNGFNIFNKKCQFSEKKHPLYIDILISKSHTLYLIEQKVRDDHDSSKKEGQINNFKKKLDCIIENYGDKFEKIIAIMFFVDPLLEKNKKYYERKIIELKSFYNSKIEIKVLYGKEFFEFFGFPEFWDLLKCYLLRWKEQIPDIPDLNFDNNPRKNAEKLLELSPRTIYKFLSNKDLWKEKIPFILFPTGSTFRILMNIIQQHSKNTKYKKRGLSQFQLIEILKYVLDNYYSQSQKR